jgi:hypothetical protein
LIAAGIAALAIGAALGSRTAPAVVAATETVQPKNFDRFPSERFPAQEPQVPASRGMQLASIDSGAVFRLDDNDPSPGLATSATSRGQAEDRTTGARGASFAERFMGAIDWPVARPSESTQVRTNRPVPASSARPPHAPSPSRPAALPSPPWRPPLHRRPPVSPRSRFASQTLPQPTI